MYEDFVIDVMGCPLVDFNPALTDGWQIPKYIMIYVYWIVGCHDKSSISWWTGLVLDLTGLVLDLSKANLHIVMINEYL